MDTLGTIAPRPPLACAESSLRTEAFERLRFLAHRGSCGVVWGGPGSGKSAMLSKLAHRLRREGCPVVEINANGIDAADFPHVLAAGLALDLPASAQERQVWSRLTDFAQGQGMAHGKIVCLMDHLDRADASLLLSLDRAMQIFFGTSAWIFAARSNSPSTLKAFLRERTWLRVELKDLDPQEASRILARELGRHAPPLRFSPEASEFALSLAKGRMDRLRQLAELATLVADAEGTTVITQDHLAAMTEELLA